MYAATFTTDHIVGTPLATLSTLALESRITATLERDTAETGHTAVWLKITDSTGVYRLTFGISTYGAIVETARFIANIIADGDTVEWGVCAA